MNENKILKQENLKLRVTMQEYIEIMKDILKEREKQN